MFGRGKRRLAQVVADRRDDFAAADSYNRTMLVEAVAQMEFRLSRDREELERSRLVTENALENIRASLEADSADFVRVLEQVVTVCGRLDKRIEADQLERHAMLDAMKRLLPPAAPPRDEPSHVIGGTVFQPSASLHGAPAPVVDLEHEATKDRDPAPANDVWSAFEGPRRREY
jgi:hypothetical protein